ncbi:hypothetical protein C2U70_22170, partial [Bradyrhizobium guangdongense]
GLVPAIHDLFCCTKNVDARDKPGHDEFAARSNSVSNYVAVANGAPAMAEMPAQTRDQCHEIDRLRRRAQRAAAVQGDRHGASRCRRAAA